jgi:hypothetical protein
MSESLTVGSAVARPDAGEPRVREPRVREQGHLAVLDTRRKLQLALGVIWLLDGILQYQPSMFSKAFPQMLAAASAGNPAVVASPVNWSANLVDHHLILLNAIFATTQLALGLGIAWRPTVKLALGASVAWALAVWWLGEGLGGVLAGTASPVNGAPGPVIIYALLAVLLWPTGRYPTARYPTARYPAARYPGARYRAAPFIAARAVGRPVAQALWLVLWGSLAFFALTPASRAPQAISGMISDMASGEPIWLAWIDHHAASALAHQGLPASIVLAAALAIVAAGIYLPSRMTRAVIVLAIVLATLIWLAEGLGGIFTGGTDPDSGPLLALLALAFWPAASAHSTPASAHSTPASAHSTPASAASAPANSASGA